MKQQIKDHKDDIPDMVTTTLLIVGGVTLGLEGATLLVETELNVFRLILTDIAGVPEAEGAVYIVFAAAAVYQLFRGYSLYQDR